MANKLYRIRWHRERPISSRRYYVVGKSRRIVSRHLIWQQFEPRLNGALLIVFRGQLLKSWYVGISDGKVFNVLKGPYNDVDSAVAMAKLCADSV